MGWEVNDQTLLKNGRTCPVPHLRFFGSGMPGRFAMARSSFDSRPLTTISSSSSVNRDRLIRFSLLLILLSLSLSLLLLLLLLLLTLLVLLLLLLINLFLKLLLLLLLLLVMFLMLGIASSVESTHAKAVVGTKRHCRTTN
jgi:hypothetical protein